MSINALSSTRMLLALVICTLTLQAGPVLAGDACQGIFERRSDSSVSLHESPAFLEFLQSLNVPDKFNHESGMHLYRGSGKVDYGADQISRYLFNDNTLNPRASSFRIALAKFTANGLSYHDALRAAAAEVIESIQKQLLDTNGDYKKFIWNQMNRSVVNLPMIKRTADVLFAEAGKPETGARYGTVSLQFSMRDHPGKTGLIEIFDINPAKLAVMKGESAQEYLVFGDLPASHLNGLFFGIPINNADIGAGARWKYIGISQRNSVDGQTTEVSIHNVETVPNPGSIDGMRFIIKEKTTSFRDQQALQKFLNQLIQK